jgi:TolB protein
VSASLTLRVTPRTTADLIYNRWSGTASEIFTLGLAVDGVPPVRINAGNVSREASPSPDGTQLVFAISQRTPMGEIQNDLYIVNRNGLNMRWLTRTDGIEDQPKWSPEGTKILFHGTTDRSDLFVINVDGTGLTNLTAGFPATMTDKRNPAWSADGSRIAFIGAVNGQHKVWVMNSDGTNARQVTTDAGFDQTPSFSPDGEQIVFARYNAAAPQLGDDVMIVSAAGGPVTRLALPGDQRTPAWSPDGRYIAISGTATVGSGQSEIYTLRPDGTGLKLRTINPAWGGGVSPAWIKR